jgi:hypothetical protein
MCDPVTMMMIASTTMTVGSTLAQGSAANKQAKFQAQQAEQQARNEGVTAAQRAEKIRRMGRQQQSEARAALAGSGVDVGQGSALVIDKQIGVDSQSDAMTELLNGTQRSNTLNDEAGAMRIAGESVKSSALLSALGSAISPRPKEKEVQGKKTEGKSALSAGETVRSGWIWDEK